MATLAVLIEGAIDVARAIHEMLKDVKDLGKDIPELEAHIDQVLHVLEGAVGLKTGPYLEKPMQDTKEALEKLHDLIKTVAKKSKFVKFLTAGDIRDNLKKCDSAVNTNISRVCATLGVHNANLNEAMRLNMANW
eukprot:CAMPEP_0119102802 /NCGR_PEP_ID=MMETSP1180-20130426/1418_1 /TAXON_ID=3052 ORGANISM="Chlamydomonas cf sp, Strain CCMP681" /NCGR_SAMPLE_ID=MMETSP1180 /ASSEMBLY_ACC=CAM_ASM_000741 /LENGTH=134 /DNA_ID=CAMNT_0007087155 /DNA_START=75 /DNA_END=479 /DNA_ORIENTATION=+